MAANHAAKVNKVTLNNGYSMPMIGLGPYGPEPTTCCEVTQAVKDAIDVGYRNFDCSNLESEMGYALTEKLASGDVKREELFITCKLWGSFHSPEAVQSALKKSLSLLGLDYLDMYLIHSHISFANKECELMPKYDKGEWMYTSVDKADTWRAMEKCVELGLTRSIGFSNFNNKQIQHVLNNCTIKPSIHQNESHPYLNQRRMIEFCQEKDIHVTAYSPLGAPNRDWARPDTPNLMDDWDILAIANKYKKTPAQLLVRYQVYNPLLSS